MHTLSGIHEHALVNLLYSNCVSILTYPCDVQEFSERDMSNCYVAINNAQRKVFGFCTWQSICVLCEMFGFKSIYKIFKTAQDRFLTQSKSHPNPIISFIIRIVLVNAAWMFLFTTCATNKSTVYRNYKQFISSDQQKPIIVRCFCYFWIRYCQVLLYLWLKYG